MPEIALVQASELAAAEIRPIEIDGHQFLLVNGEGGPSLIARTCPHAGGDLVKGKIVGDRIQCPTHRYLFNLRTGVCPLGRREGWGPLTVHELSERDGQLYVDL